MQVGWYAPLIMQTAATAADVASFAAATIADKLAILRDRMASAVDKLLFIPMPTTLTPVRPCSALVLAAKDDAGTEHIIAICDVVSRPIVQYGNLVLKHASITEPWAYGLVMQVAVRAVLGRPMTWSDTLAIDVPLDVHYMLDAGRKQQMAATIATLNTMYYELDDVTEPTPIRILMTRSHYAAHMAFAQYGGALITEWLRQFAPFQAPMVRAVLVGRLHQLCTATSPKPKFQLAALIMTTGVPLYSIGEDLPRSEPYDNFRAKMLEFERAGME